MKVWRVFLFSNVNGLLLPITLGEKSMSFYVPKCCHSGVKTTGATISKNQTYAHLDAYIAHSACDICLLWTTPKKGVSPPPPLCYQGTYGSGSLARNGLVLSSQFLFCLLTFLHFHFSTLKKWAFWLAAVTKGSAAEAVAPHFVLGADDGQKIRPICACSLLGSDNSIIVIRLLHIHFHSFVIRSLVSYFRGAAFSCFASVWSRRDLSALKNGSLSESTAHAPKIRTAYCCFAFATCYLINESKVQSQYLQVMQYNGLASCVYIGLLEGSSLLFWPNLFVLRWKLCFAQVSSVLSSAIFGFS